MSTLVVLATELGALGEGAGDSCLLKLRGEVVSTASLLVVAALLLGVGANETGVSIVGVCNRLSEIEGIDINGGLPSVVGVSSVDFSFIKCGSSLFNKVGVFNNARTAAVSGIEGVSRPSPSMMSL